MVLGAGGGVSYAVVIACVELDWPAKPVDNTCGEAGQLDMVLYGSLVRAASPISGGDVGVRRIVAGLRGSFPTGRGASFRNLASGELPPARGIVPTLADAFIAAGCAKNDGLFTV